MLARIRKAMTQKDQGFTLIELLVVVIIIGILAAIAIPTFLSQRESGYRAQVISDLRNTATLAETFAVDHGGKYTGMVVGDVEGEKSAAVNITAVVVPTGATTFCIQATHDDLPDDTFAFAKATREPAAGTCGTGGALDPA